MHSPLVGAVVGDAEGHLTWSGATQGTSGVTYSMAPGRGLGGSAIPNFDLLEAEGLIDSEDRGIFWFAETAQEACQGILDWHDGCEEPLFPRQPWRILAFPIII